MPYPPKDVLNPPSPQVAMQGVLSSERALQEAQILRSRVAMHQLEAVMRCTPHTDLQILAPPDPGAPWGAA